MMLALVFLALVVLMPLAFAVTLGWIVLAALWLYEYAVRLRCAVARFERSNHPRLLRLVPPSSRR